MKTNKHVNYNKLHELFYYNPITGLLIRRKSNKVVGTITDNGYLTVGIEGKIYRVHRVAWCMHHGYWPENEIDHINRIRHDNRIENLREVSHACNLRNAKLASNNSSGIRGVYWEKKSKKWRAFIEVNKKRIGLGSYKNIENAVIARFLSELEHNWNVCDKNSTAYQYLVEHNLIEPHERQDT